ncbi:MAG: hypothetical protein OEZ48_06540 [Candidatus Bathyarchaeota archaeon]|nr:hypothetical protein [Candidatus Bathyarchaeota archaeon]
MREEKLLDVKEEDKRDDIEIYVKYGGFEEDFKGPVDQVLRALISSLDKICPGLEVLSRVRLTVDLQGLIEKMEGIVAIAQSGPIMLSEKKLTVKELVGLNLLGAFVGYKLNLFDDPSLSLDDLVTLTGKNKGSISRRITTLVNDRWVERLERGEYRISTLGVKHFEDEILPNLREEKC